MSDSLLNSDLALRRAFDPTTDKLKVDAEVTAVIGTVEVVIDATSDNIAIKNSISGNELKVNSDGSIDTNVIINASNDNIAISDGTNTLEINPDGSLNAQTVVAQYALRLDDTSTPNITYVGEANVGSLDSSAVWRIKQIDETTGLVIKWADGNANFDNNWNNRTSLTYT